MYSTLGAKGSSFLSPLVPPTQPVFGDVENALRRQGETEVARRERERVANKPAYHQTPMDVSQLPCRPTNCQVRTTTRRTRPIGQAHAVPQQRLMGFDRSLSPDMACRAPPVTIKQHMEARARENRVRFSAPTFTGEPSAAWNKTPHPLDRYTAGACERDASTPPTPWYRRDVEARDFQPDPAIRFGWRQESSRDAAEREWFYDYRA